MHINEIDVPEDWNTCSIREVIVHTKQRDPSNNPETSFRYVDVSSVDNTLFKVRSTVKLKGAEAPSRARKEIRAGDVLFATVRPTLKRVALIPPELDGEIASTGYCVLRANREKVEPEFLYNCVLTDWFIDAMCKLERGANYPAVRDSDVFKAMIPLPPLPEQRKIAAVLGLVQQAIEKQERLITLTTELKKTLLHKLFTQGLRGEPQKQTEIGLVPESWEVTKISNLLKFSSGKPRPQDMEPTTSESKPFPVFGGNGVLGYSGSFLLEEPVLILGRVGEYCGCAHHTNGRAWISDNALYTKEIMDNIDTHYAAEYLAYADLNQYSNRAGQPLITQGIISEVKIPLPSLDEQREILEPLRLLNQKRKYHEAKRNAVADLFRTLLHQLMTAQIRVHNLDLPQIDAIQ